jgi:superkiller protein 3
MNKLTFKGIYTKINLWAGLLISATFSIANPVLAQTFEPTWEVIEISQGPHSENLEASQVFTTALYYYYGDNLKYAALAFQKALTYDPNMAIAYYLLGNSLYQLDRVEDAMVEYTKAIKANPFEYKVYNNLGTALADLGQYEEAIAQYEQALEIEPNFPLAVYNMGIAFIQLRQYEQGLSFLEQAKKMFIRAGDWQHANATEKYIQCGVLPFYSGSNYRRPPICES